MGLGVGFVVNPAQVAHEHCGHRVEAVVGVLLFDLVPERAQQLDGLIQSAARVAVQTRDHERRDLRRERDPQFAGRGTGGVQKWTHGRLGTVAVDGSRAGADIVEQRRVDRPSG